MTPSHKKDRYQKLKGFNLRRDMSQQAGNDEERLTVEENKVFNNKMKKRHQTRRKNNRTIERKLRE